jgi:hypothetical protein
VTCDSVTQSFGLKSGEGGFIDVPQGDGCVITEPVVPLANSGYKYIIASIDPWQTTLKATGVSVTVENKVVPDDGTVYREMTLTNAVLGDKLSSGYIASSQQFTVTTNCGTDYTWASTRAEGDVVYYSVPSGRSCTLTTTTGAGTLPALFSSHGWDRHDAQIGASPLPLNTFSVNSYPVDPISVVKVHSIKPVGTELVTVTKTLAGNPSLYVSGRFDVTLTCTKAGSPTVTEPFEFTPGGTMTDSVWVDVGYTCEVSESTTNAVINGTSRRTIVPYRFTVEDGGQTVSVENELLAGNPSMAPLVVNKKVTGATAAHNPANVFGITVQCPGTSTSTKPFNLRGGQSGMTDVVIGDTCAIAEPVIPAAIGSYVYAPSIIPSSVTVLTGGRSVDVINNLVLGPIETITFIQSAVVDASGSGYVAGSILTTIINCGTGGVYTLPLAEGEQATVAVPRGSSCTASRGAMPTLNSGFYFDSPVTMPLNFLSAVNSSGNVYILYGIKKQNNEPPKPIPALDPKALLLLMGLLSGVVFWRSRQRQPDRGRAGR